MLQFIRDQATGWIAWAIIILISIPFAMWGIYNYVTPRPSVSVATVNGTELSIRQFQQAYRRHQRRLQQMLGASFDIRQLDDKLVREQSLDGMVREELLVQMGQSDGLRISDAQLAGAIHAQPLFQEGGQFSQARYDQFLQRQGYSAGGFEFDLRRSLLGEQISSGIAGSTITTASEKARMLALIGQTRDISVLRIAPDRFSGVPIPEEEIQGYFSDHQAELMTPELVTIEYVSVSEDDLAKDVVIDEASLRARYESSKESYTTPESRRVSHILFQVPDDADEAAIEQARGAADAVRRQIDEGGDFAKLAGEHSDDPGSAGRGGDLGYFERGVMVDQRLEDAVFSMARGEVSAPVRSSAGIHLLKLTDIKAGQVKTFEEARDEVLREFQLSEAEQMFFDRVERLANLAFESPDSLELAAEELGLDIESAGPFGTQGDPTDLIAGDPKVVEAAFSLEVLEEGNNSDVIELSGGRSVVVRAKDHRPARPQTLDEARELIGKRLESEAARARAEAAGRDALQRLEGGESREAVAASLGAQWVAHAGVGRQATGIDSAVLRRVFTMPRPESGAVTYSATFTSDGDFMLVVLGGVTPGRADAMQADQIKAIEEQLALDRGQAAYEAYLRAVREQAEVVIHEETLQSG